MAAATLPPIWPIITCKSNDGDILHVYCLVDQIGNTTSSTTSVTIPVYEVLSLPYGNKEYYEFVSMVITNINPETPGENERFALAGAIYPPITHDNFYCIVFPYMEHGSIKSVMTKYFPEGIPEDGILVVLKRALMRLREIHQKGFCHREICSAHIYVSKTEIKMGFSTSVFNLHEDVQDSDAIHTWAAAPEVFYGGEYTEKCDVWSIGFTALEMLYGGFEPINRDYLEYVLKTMRTEKKLSGKSIVMNVTGPVPVTKKPLKKRVLEKLNRLKKKNKYKVSEECVEMVLSCLVVNPDQRPTVEDLLQLRIFRELQRDAAYFQDLLVNKAKKKKSSQQRRARI